MLEFIDIKTKYLNKLRQGYYSNKFFVSRHLIMKIFNYQCDCQKQINAEIGQNIVNLELRWYIFYQCPYCQSCVEIDDIGFLPSNFRKIIISKEGLWKLEIDRSDLDKKQKSIKTIRKVLNLSINDAINMMKNFPEITRGTKTEMYWLQEILKSQMISSSIKKIDDSQINSNNNNYLSYYFSPEIIII